MKQISTTKTFDEDMDEYPEITQADFDRASYKVAGQIVNKELWQHAVQSKLKKTKINITLDPDIVAYFKDKAGGRGYQTLINATLREAMNHQNLEETLRKVLREELRHV